jgi:hypothetical protein
VPGKAIDFDVWRTRKDHRRFGGKAGAVFAHRDGDQFDPAAGEVHVGSLTPGGIADLDANACPAGDSDETIFEGLSVTVTTSKPASPLFIVKESRRSPCARICVEDINHGQTR